EGLAVFKLLPAVSHKLFSWDPAPTRNTDTILQCCWRPCPVAPGAPPLIAV
ncbi:hypothetical protein KUCAC02_006224, partial [Chaenocephalus aceratus]